MSKVWSMDRSAAKQLAAYVNGMADRVQQEKGLAPPAGSVPSDDDLAEILEVAFWASVIPDEGRYSPFALVFCPPESGCLKVSERALTPENVAKLAPVATDLARIGVQRGEAGLVIWGVNPGHATFLNVRAVAPGHIVVSMDFENLASFRGNEGVSLVTEHPTKGPHGLGRLHVMALLGDCFASTQSPAKRVLTGLCLLMTADAMRAHRNGGTILVLPDREDARTGALEWLELGPNRLVDSVGLQPIFDKYLPMLNDMADPVGAATLVDGLGGYLINRRERADPSLLQPTTVLGNLTAIDGALVVTEEFEILAFGATIRQPSTGPIKDVIYRRSFLDYNNPARQGAEVRIGALGGTRRRSSAMFVANNYDTVALTASHDGPLSFAAWFVNVGEVEGPRPHLMTDLETILD